MVTEGKMYLGSLSSLRSSRASRWTRSLFVLSLFVLSLVVLSLVVQSLIMGSDAIIGFFCSVAMVEMCTEGIKRRSKCHCYKLV